jgi:hypothetical protein
LIQIDGIILANAFADAAFFVFKVKTTFIDICNQGNSLRKINMDGFIIRYFLIKLVWVFRRAIFDTGSTTRAIILDNVSGFFNQSNFEVTCFTLYIFYFGVSQDLYIRMPSNLDELGSEYSYGAVISWKGLIKLGHVAANRRRFIHHVHFKTRCGKVK